jgi:hypothetical protein
VIQTFKGALHEVIFNSKIPAKQLCDIVGKSPTYLYNAANESQEDSHLRGRDVTVLTNATGNYALLDHMEAACGRVAFPIPELETKRVESYKDALLDTHEKVAGLYRAHREAMADNILSVEEDRELEALENEVVKAAMNLRRGLRK